jgi:hypothetical protein
MANLNDKLKEAQKLLKQIEQSYKILGDKNPFESLDPKNADLDKLKQELKEVNEYINLLDTDASSIFQSFKSITEEIGNNNKAYSSASKSLSSLTSISGQLRDHQSDINKLSSKQLSSLKSKISSETANLKVSRDLLLDKSKSEELSNKEKVMLTNIQGLLDEKDSTLKSLNKTSIEELKNREKIDKQLGIAGGILKGLSKIPILGNVFEANTAVEAMEENLKKTNSPVKALGAGFKNIGKQIREGMLNPANLVLGIITGLINGFIQSQKSIGELAKGLGMSASSAVQMRQDFASIANSSMDANVSVKGLQESQLAVGQALGTNAQLNESDLKTLTKITKQTGLTHAELMGMEKLSLAQGKNLDKQVKSTLGGANAYAMQNKLVVNQNKVLQEVSKASSSLKLSLGGSVEALGKAVVQTQKMGINLETANSLAQSLLNFESSIEAELEAELLTGKNLNFEKARQLSLEGDIAGAAEEVLKQVKGTEEFSKMNVIQQEAMAKAVGMTRDQLADSLIEREALAKMSEVEGKTALERYNLLKSQGKSQAEIVKLLGEESAEKLQQQSSQEKFNNALEKAQEIFVQIMDAVAPIFEVLSSIATIILPAINFVLSPLVEGFTLIGGAVSSFVQGLKDGKGPAIALAAVLGTMALPLITSAIGAIFSTFAQIPLGIGIPLALTSIAGLFSLMSKAKSTTSSMQDGMIGPGGEMVVSGPKGSIQLDKDDSIIAGTDLFGGDKKSNSSTTQQPTQTTQASVDMTQTNALLQQLISVIQSGGTVILDGQKVGTALKLGTYQIQ